MISRTNASIDETREQARLRAEHRKKFYRMLRSTDRVLWLLEELNLDGVGDIPDPARPRIEEELAALPDRARRRFRGSAVQDALDSIFEVQEELFRWRHPEVAFEDEDLVRTA